ncbi:MAG: hypothetical protein PWQ57_1910 [Desulfovibrionales bacterium]|nr:hypothetical protein [Desulfovibrionales bacterium]
MRRRALFLLLLLVLLTLPVCAEGEGLPATTTAASLSFREPGETPEGNLTIRLDSTYVGSANFRKSSGGVESFSNRIAVSGAIWSASFTQTRYIWHDVADLPLTEGDLAPWEALYDLDLALQAFEGKFCNDFYYWINVKGTAGFEEDFPGALSLGLSGELAYDVYEGWMLGLVASSSVLSPLSSGLFNELELTAALHVSQKHIKLLLDFLGLDHESTQKTYSFHVAFSEKRQVYRLSSSSNVSNNGYASIQRTMVGGYLDVLFDKNWTFSLGPEYYFYRKYKVYDSKGNFLSNAPLNESFGGQFSFGYMF